MVGFREILNGKPFAPFEEKHFAIFLLERKTSEKKIARFRELFFYPIFYESERGCNRSKTRRPAVNAKLHFSSFPRKIQSAKNPGTSNLFSQARNCFQNGINLAKSCYGHLLRSNWADIAAYGGLNLQWADITSLAREKFPSPLRVWSVFKSAASEMEASHESINLQKPSGEPQRGNSYYPTKPLPLHYTTEHFTISEPENPPIHEF